MEVNNLFPEGYEEETITAEEVGDAGPIGYRMGPAFDEETGDFVRNGKNQVITCTGVEAWESWCRNCLKTDRYKHLAYSTDYAIEWDMVFKALSRAEAEAIASRQISEALMADPYGRTKFVEGIEYDWTAPDAVNITATVRGIDNVTIDIEVNITRGEG